MFIEQIIEFELRGSGPPGRICIPKTGYFCDKTKSSKANLEANYYFMLKILQKAMHLGFPWPGQNQLQNLSKKC